MDGVILCLDYWSVLSHALLVQFNKDGKSMRKLLSRSNATQPHTYYVKTCFD